MNLNLQVCGNCGLAALEPRNTTSNYETVNWQSHQAKYLQCRNLDVVPCGTSNVATPQNIETTANITCNLNLSSSNMRRLEHCTVNWMNKTPGIYELETSDQLDLKPQAEEPWTESPDLGKWVYGDAFIGQRDEKNTWSRLWYKFNFFHQYFGK